MKKLLGILMILILIAGVFVSCSQDKIEEAAVSGEELLNVSFDASSGRARDLVVDTPEFDDGDYVWYYTAKKADSTGFNTGAKSVKTPVKDPDVPIEDRDERKGLSGAVISGLSQGYWDFGLYAYVPVADTEVTPHDYSGDDVAWQGSVSHFLLVKGAANVVDVTVSPSTQGKGYLVVDLEHITVDDDPITAHPGTSLVYTVTRVGGTQSIPIEDNQGNPLPIDAGAYVVKVVCTGSNIDYAEDSIVVNVYSGLTRRVWGSIGELTTSATFGDITGEIIEASTPKIDQDYLNHLTTDSVEFTSDEGTVPVTASLPKTAAQVLLDSVTTPGSSTDLTLTLNVKADTETTSGTTTTKAYNIDLVQKVVTTTESSSTTTVSNVTSVLSDYLTATITIEKNLGDTVKVKHTLAGEAVPMFDLGTADTPTDTQIAADATAGYPGFYKYDSATGVLTLMTKKFSPFQVTYTKPVSGIARVTRIVGGLETTIADCKSLEDAFELALDGDTVLVVAETSPDSGTTVSKEIVIKAVSNIKGISSPYEDIVGRGYKGIYDSDNNKLTIMKTPVTDAVARIDEGDVKLYFNTLQEAINAALDGETIVVLKSITTDAGYQVYKAGMTINLDVSGETITVNNGSNVNNRAFRIDAGTLNVYGNGKIVAVGSGTTAATGQGCYGAFRIEAAGKVIVSNMTLENARPWGLNVKVNGGEAELTNVKITSSYGGGIEVTEADLGTHSKKGIATLTNCTFTQTGHYDHCSTAVSVSGGSKLIVNSGTYSGEYGLYVFSSGGEIEVKGGSFAAISKNVFRAAIDTETYPQYEGGFKVSGGNFTGTFSIVSPAYMSITGGTFDHDPSAYVADGYYAKYHPATDTADAYWTVESIPSDAMFALINNETQEVSFLTGTEIHKYDFIHYWDPPKGEQGFVIPANHTLRLLNNYTYTVGGHWGELCFANDDITFDLNGCTLTIEPVSVDTNYLFYSTSACERLTIMSGVDGGTIKHNVQKWTTSMAYLFPMESSGDAPDEASFATYGVAYEPIDTSFAKSGILNPWTGLEIEKNWEKNRPE